jgi:hypothetical protein
VHGVARPRNWDAVVAAAVPDLRGDRLDFVALPDGTLVVEDGEEGGGDPAPLAEALEEQLSPPYRAEAVRRHRDVWAVAGRRIEVLTFTADGEEIELTQHAGERALSVDSLHAFGTIPALEAVGERQGDSYVVRAQRIDGDAWEVQADPL